MILIFAGCAVLSPVSSGLERLAVFPGIEDVQPRWQVFTGGVNFFQGMTGSVWLSSDAYPLLRFYALQVDLLHPAVEIVVKSGSSGRHVSGFVRDNDLAAGINALPFDIVYLREGRPIQNIGLVVSNGLLLSPAYPHFDALVFYNNGRAAIVSQSSVHSTENIKNAAGGFNQILADGEPVERILSLKVRHPRSAAGVSSDGRFLYLLVIDGRRAGSIGATEKDTALLLRSLGAYSGINFDGGGSSALVLRLNDGRIRTVNIPIHAGVPGLERPVAGSIGIRDIR